MKLFMPAHMVIHITEACNLKCIHCYASAGYSKKSHMKLETYKSLLDSLKNLGTLFLSVSGGEPLLHPDIVEILEYSKKLNMRVLLTTNGTLINKKIAKKLSELGVSVQVSIDHSNSKKNDKFRGVPGAQKSAIIGIKNCVEFGVPVHTMTTLSKFNKNDISKMCNLFRKIKVDSICFERFCPVGRGKDESKIELGNNEFRLILEKIKEENNKSKVPVTTTDPLYILIDKDIDKGVGCGGCTLGLSGCAIFPNGDVTPCNRLLLKLGNINETPFRKIWEESEVLNILRKRSGLKGRCKNCEIMNKCFGCRASAYYRYGGILEEDPYCWK